MSLLFISRKIMPYIANTGITYLTLGWDFVSDPKGNGTYALTGIRDAGFIPSGSCIVDFFFRMDEALSDNGGTLSFTGTGNKTFVGATPLSYLAGSSLNDMFSVKGSTTIPGDFAATVVEVLGTDTDPYNVIRSIPASFSAVSNTDVYMVIAGGSGNVTAGKVTLVVAFINPSPVYN